MSKLTAVLNILAEGAVVPPEYDDHKLHGVWNGCRELHIESDWLLIYRRDGQNLIVYAMGTGTHADLFKK